MSHLHRRQAQDDTAHMVARANGLLVLAIAAAMLSGCGTVSNAAALLHTNPLYLVAPRFVGPQGPLTARQAQLVIARMREHQETPSDILQRHLAFEQALTNVPLAVGNKITLLKNATDTYKAMLAAIGSATDTINIGIIKYRDHLAHAQYCAMFSASST